MDGCPARTGDDMLRRMNGRSPRFRFLALAFAALQLVSPALVGIADGRSVRDAVAASIPHVEADGATGCPQVHLPDCALCRYLSAGASLVSGLPEAVPHQQRAAFDARASVTGAGATAFLPDGRAPPLA